MKVQVRKVGPIKQSNIDVQSENGAVEQRVGEEGVNYLLMFPSPRTWVLLSRLGTVFKE